jgi:CubicO group peptidase (beta-lactamase class C family)
MHRSFGVVLLVGALSAGCQQCLAPVFVSEERLKLSDPDRAAHNFQSMSEIFPTRTVSRHGRIHHFEREERPLGEVAYDFGGEYRTIRDFFARNRTAGIVVLHGGTLVFEHYRLGADETTRFTSWSVAKSFTSTLVGLAIGDGVIASVDEPLVKYLPGLEGSGYDGVTIKQALQMSSGVGFSEEYGDEASDIVDFMGYTMFANLEPANQFMTRYARVAEPGSVFNYSTGETQVLGWLVTEVTGKPLAHYLSERIWSRLGMEHDATWILDREGREGMEMAGCCLNAALRDYARFGQLFLQDGWWEGERILPEGWVAEATVPDSPQVDYGALFPNSTTGYQFQWWALTGPDRAYSAEGVHGQFIFVNPAHDVVIAMTSAWPVAWEDNSWEEVMAAFKAIVHALDPGAGSRSTDR